jgi:hypothetical protein
MVSQSTNQHNLNILPTNTNNNKHLKEFKMFKSFFSWLVVGLALATAIAAVVGNVFSLAIDTAFLMAVIPTAAIGCIVFIVDLVIDGCKDARQARRLQEWNWAYDRLGSQITSAVVELNHCKPGEVLTNEVAHTHQHIALVAKDMQTNARAYIVTHFVRADGHIVELQKPFKRTTI